MGNAYQRGVVLYGAKRYAMAADEFRRELSEYPNDGPSLAMLSMALGFMGSLPEAVVAARGAVSNAPELAFCHYALAMTQFKSSQRRWFYPRRRTELEESRRSAMEAIRLDQNNADYLSLMAILEAALGNRAEALGWANDALATDPTHVNALRHRAHLLMNLGLQLNATKATADALSAAPDDSSVHATAGWTSLNNCEPAKALAHFRQSLTRDPANKSAATGLSLLNRKTTPYRLAFMRMARGLPQSDAHCATELVSSKRPALRVAIIGGLLALVTVQIIEQISTKKNIEKRSTREAAHVERPLAKSSEQTATAK